MQIRHNAIVTKCKWDKMQNWQNANVTKRQKQTKCNPDKMPTRQNANVTKCKSVKLQM